MKTPDKIKEQQNNNQQYCQKGFGEFGVGGGLTSVTSLRETASCGGWNVGGMIHPFVGWSGGVNEMDDFMDSRVIVLPTRDAWMMHHPRTRKH